MTPPRPVPPFAALAAADHTGRAAGAPRHGRPCHHPPDQFARERLPIGDGMGDQFVHLYPALRIERHANRLWPVP